MDTATYAFFIAGDWDRLIAEGRKALEEDIDFYYLRFRMGVAYYEKKNYHHAAVHLGKAYAANPEDVLLQEYLYYACLFSGRPFEARRLAAGFPEELKLKTGTGASPFVRHIDLVYNTNAVKNASLTANFPTDQIPSLDGAQFISNGHQYHYLGLQHDISPSVSIYHAYSGMAKRHFIFSRQDGAAYTSPDFKTTLHQYYISGNTRVARNLNLLFGLQYINIRYPEEVVVERPGRTFVTTVTVSQGDYLAFAGAYKNMRFVTLGGAFYYGALNGLRQYQKDLKLIIYPLGNSSLYTVSLLSHQTQTTLNSPAKHRFITDQQIGVKLWSGVWLEGYATFGEMQNFVMNDGVVVFNGLDTIRNRYGGRLRFFSGRHAGLSIEYTFFKNESSFVPEAAENGVFNTVQYVNHSITGGLSWTF